jgi:FecR-like protein
MLVRSSFALLTVLASALLGGLSPALAQDSLAQDALAQDAPAENAPAQDSWRISKSSGDVSVSTEGLQLVALTNGMILQPGAAIRTGQNGRVLLTRGNETILISANSAVSIPKKDKKDGLSTTILQQAGSILLEVEKRGINHFEVETPHLSAVVKGTRFHVTINESDTRVGVFRGQVEVTDFRSGQHTLINAGQSAGVSVQGPAGLSVSGSGMFSPIQQGTPRPSSASPVDGPGQGFSPPPSPEGSSQGLSPLPSPAAPAAIQRQARTPLLGEIQTVALPERDAAQRDGWGPGLTALSERTLGGKADADTLSFAFPFVVGAVVAMMIAVRRRRQQQKLSQASGQ